MNPRCYVAIPSGKKSYHNLEIDFDEIYRTLIYPAAARAICPFDVVTLNECMMSNSPITDTAIQLITKSPLMICDITTDNPNVIYELGVRHASAPGGTVIIRQQTCHPVPFYLRNVFIHSYKYPVSDNDLTQQVANLAGVINKIYCDKSSNQVYRMRT